MRKDQELIDKVSDLSALIQLIEKELNGFWENQKVGDNSPYHGLAVCAHLADSLCENILDELDE